MSTTLEIKNLVHAELDTSTNDFTDAKMLLFMNKGQDKIVNLIMRNDTEAQWDDKNYTDLPEGFLNIVSGQNDYSVEEDSNNAETIAIWKVFVLDSASATEYKELEKAGKFFDVDEGSPTKYRQTGRDIIVSPEPQYNATNGLKLQFTRVPEAITALDASEVGIPETYNYLLALYVEYSYARSKVMANRNDILNEIEKEEKNLGLYIVKQSGNVVNRMKPNVENNK